MNSDDVADYKKQIKKQQNIIYQAHHNMKTIADKAMKSAKIKIPSIDTFTGEVSKGYYDNAQWFHIGVTWPCEKSPFGYCMYHNIHDPAKDNCVFCHEPYERK